MSSPYAGFLKLCAFCFVYLTWSLVAFYSEGVSGKVYIAGCLLLFVTGGAWMVYTVKSKGQDSQACTADCTD